MSSPRLDFWWKLVHVVHIKGLVVCWISVMCWKKKKNNKNYHSSRWVHNIIIFILFLSHLRKISKTSTYRLFNKILCVINVVIWPINKLFSEEHCLRACRHAAKQSPGWSGDFLHLGIIGFCFGLQRAHCTFKLEFSFKEILCKSHAFCSRQIMTVSTEPKVHFWTKVKNIGLEQKTYR